MNAPQQQGVHFYFYFFVFMVIRSRLLSISICGNFIFSSVINLYIAEIFAAIGTFSVVFQRQRYQPNYTKITQKHVKDFIK
ncbi:MAG TPA: hypothetical protein DHU65_06760 [Clostridiales bacterium]|nr:hypothetical protein [Clostridiales bacterium]